MVDAGPYLLSVVLLALLAGSLSISAITLRRRLLPAWQGAPAHLVDSVAAVGLLVLLAELLGLVGLLHGWLLVACSMALFGAIVLRPPLSTPPPAGGASPSTSPPAGGVDTEVPSRVSEGSSVSATGPAGQSAVSMAATGPAGQSARLMALIAVGAVAVVFALWGLTAMDALGRGIFNFDSLWYHVPFSLEMAQSHSVTGFHYPETVFTNWFYPQNSELLGTVAILLTERDTLLLFLNFGWLAMAFLAAWCLGRPYGVAPHAVVAAAIVLGAYTLVVREPGAAKNDVMAAALLLASIAILLNANMLRPRGGRHGGTGSLPGSSPEEDAPVRDPQRGEEEDAARRPHPHTDPPVEGRGSENAPPAGGVDMDTPCRVRQGVSMAATGPAGRELWGREIWALAVAGLAVGLAAGTKVTVLAMAGVLTLAVVVLARGWRWRALGWWTIPALAGGGFWYLRNLVAVGNPLPQIERLGPLSLPHPEQLQSGRPDFSVAHYATDTAVWREYFFPGLDHAFGLLWPLVLAAAVLAGALAIAQRRDRVLRWTGVVVLAGLLAYLFTPLGAAGLEGAPEAFRINLRFLVPALLAGIVLLPPAIATWLSLASSPPAGGADMDTPSPEAGDTSLSTPPPAGDTSLSTPSPAGGVDMDSPCRVRQGVSMAATGPAGRDAWPLASWTLLAALALTFVITTRADAALRDPDRLAAWALAALFILIPAVLLWARSRGAPRGAVAAGFAALALAVAAIGYPVQRAYLDDRFANADPARAIPGMDMSGAYRWARGVEDARIGLAGTTAGFFGLGFYGTDLSNEVVYLGARGPHGAFNPLPTCATFRTAVNAAELDYLITAPFLNFIRPGNPIPSPEARWLRGDPAATPIKRGGPVTVWRVQGRLDPGSCRDDKRAVPQQPN